MAANLYFRNSGSTSANLATNWSLSDGGAGNGYVPTSGDDSCFFTANSGNIVLDRMLAMSSLTCTGYSGTITFSNEINFAIGSSGNLVLSPTMTMITGTSGFTANGSCTITTNGKDIPVPLSLVGNTTLVNTLVVKNTLTIGYNMVFTGAGGFTVDRLYYTTTSAYSTTLKTGNIYIVNIELRNTASTNANRWTVKSDVAGTRARLINNGTSTFLNYTNFTDIDASGGNFIYVPVGIVTNSINIGNSFEPTIVPTNTATSFIT